MQVHRFGISWPCDMRLKQNGTAILSTQVPNMLTDEALRAMKHLEHEKDKEETVHSVKFMCFGVEKGGNEGEDHSPATRTGAAQELRSATKTDVVGPKNMQKYRYLPAGSRTHIRIGNNNGAEAINCAVSTETEGVDTRPTESVPDAKKKQGCNGEDHRKKQKGLKLGQDYEELDLWQAGDDNLKGYTAHTVLHWTSLQTLQSWA